MFQSRLEEARKPTDGSTQSVSQSSQLEYLDLDLDLGPSAGQSQHSCRLLTPQQPPQLEEEMAEKLDVKISPRLAAWWERKRKIPGRAGSAGHSSPAMPSPDTSRHWSSVMMLLV